MYLKNVQNVQTTNNNGKTMQSNKTDKLLLELCYWMNTAANNERKYENTNHPSVQIYHAQRINHCTVNLIEFLTEIKKQNDLTDGNIEFLQHVKETIKRLASEYSWAL